MLLRPGRTVEERVFLADSVLPPFGGAGPILVGTVVRQSRPLSFNVQRRADPCALLAPVLIPVRVDRHRPCALMAPDFIRFGVDGH